jgi:hypothetical protein
MTFTTHFSSYGNSFTKVRAPTRSPNQIFLGGLEIPNGQQ